MKKTTKFNTIKQEVITSVHQGCKNFNNDAGRLAMLVGGFYLDYVVAIGAMVMMESAALAGIAESSMDRMENLYL